MLPLRTVVVACNERGLRIGEHHHNARISDATVDRIRELHEDYGRTYRGIAQDLNIALTTVRKICAYQRRAQTPAKWKRIKVQIPIAQSGS
jgi:DNA invertase Pin-like site-specific DNA recombinase